MNAINHTATALVLNRKWPGVPIIPVMISTQFIEIIWVILNYGGVEYVTTEPQVRSLADVHLAHMPWSHSVGITLLIALAAWALFAKGLKRPLWGMALAAGIISHIVLDIATHAPDVVLAPGVMEPKFGTGLYAVPIWAFALEFVYGIACWFVFKGSKWLLAAIVIANLMGLSTYWPLIAGPEQFFAGAPFVFVGVVTAHIIMGFVVIGYFAKNEWRG